MTDLGTNHKEVAAIAIFCVTYALISGRRWAVLPSEPAGGSVARGGAHGGVWRDDAGASLSVRGLSTPGYRLDLFAAGA